MSQMLSFALSNPTTTRRAKQTTKTSVLAPQRDPITMGHLTVLQELNAARF